MNKIFALILTMLLATSCSANSKYKFNLGKKKETKVHKLGLPRSLEVPPHYQFPQ